MGRVILIGVGMLVCMESTAHDLCDGKYSAAMQMIDAAYGKYGALYSGGDHWHSLDNVGATVDLYRLWKGLPDLHLRNLQGEISEENASNLKTQSAVTGALWLGTAESQPDVSEDGLLRAITTLDLMTTPGVPIDWWRSPRDLGEASSITAAFAKEHVFVDWLQFVAAASDIPEQQFWHWQSEDEDLYEVRYRLYKQPGSRNFNYGKLSTQAWEEYEKTNGPEWFVASFLFNQSSYLCDSCETRDYAPVLSQWKAKISACQASEQEYAAFASAYLNAIRLKSNIEDWSDVAYLPKTIKNLATAVSWKDMGFLPESIKKLAIKNYALLRISKIDELKSNDPDTLDEDKISDNTSKPWHELAKFYSASSPEELSRLDLNHLDRKAIRALNLLSADNLLFLSRNNNVDATTSYALALAAFQRYFALGQDKKAFEILETIKRGANPSVQKNIDLIVARSISQDLKLALINLNLNSLGVWVNLPSSNSADGDVSLDTWFDHFKGCDSYFKLPNPIIAAQADLDAWLLAPRKWDRVYSMHGSTNPIIDRAHNSLRTVPSVRSPSVTDELPFSKLIAWSEIASLGEDNAYLRRVSLVIIEWAKSSGSSRVVRRVKETLKLQSEEIPEALNKIVLNSKTCPLNDVNGKPIAQLAFQLLHHDYPNSEWIKKTPYWWNP